MQQQPAAPPTSHHAPVHAKKVKPSNAGAFKPNLPKFPRYSEEERKMKLKSLKNTVEKAGEKVELESEISRIINGDENNNNGS
jgi:hypothetical protein